MSEQQTGLPENAMRELKPGETYEPLMPASDNPREVTLYSVLMGVAMAILFSAASAYLGLKVGQVFEAAIPIAIIAVGISGITMKKGSGLGQNVIIQSIGACSGVVVAGAIFTLPALYILQAKYPEMTVNFFEIFFASLMGGILGILFLIPFRKYFVKDMHGKYPFPEATASTQVLVTGEKGGSQVKPLLMAGIIGGLYDFAVSAFGLWNETFTSRCFAWGEAVAEKAKLVFKMNTGAAVIGMGYIVGLKYAFIICCGSMLVWWIIVPAISAFLPELVIDAKSGLTATDASAEQIFTYAKSIGIGGIATAGIIGIIKSWKIICGAVGLASRELSGKKGEDGDTPRTQRDLPMKFVAMGILAALVMGGVVCTALSMAGGFVTDLKIGYWLGSTPQKQQSWKFLGTLVSAATVAGVIMILNKTYGFGPESSLAAPQANAMAAVIEPLMSGQGAPWALYGIGAGIAILLTIFNVSALAFALGMFIPLDLNLPILLGGAINWFVTTRSKDEQVNKERGEKGTLISSGFIAGGALMGVVAAAMKFCGVSIDFDAWWANPLSEILSLGMVCCLIIYLTKASMKK